MYLELLLHSRRRRKGTHVTAVQFAQKAVVTRNDQILLVRKSEDDPYYPGWWELPGGRLRVPEDVDTHMKREVLEETGLTVCPGALIDLWSWDMSWHGEDVRVVAVSRYCTVEPGSRHAKVRREPDDYLAEQRWFSKSDLQGLEIVPSQLRTIKMVVDAEPK
jgi:8-oxo-dGTP pyrophosphatase MutT (NUDIX family)